MLFLTKKKNTMLAIVYFMFCVVFGVCKHGACCWSIRGLLCSSGGRIQPQYSHWPEEQDTRLPHWGMYSCASGGSKISQTGGEGRQNQGGTPTYYSANISPKTAWKFRKLDPYLFTLCGSCHCVLCQTSFYRRTSLAFEWSSTHMSHFYLWVTF